MSDKRFSRDFRTVLSIDPLMDFWRAKVAPNCPHMAEMFSVFEQRIHETPALQGEIDDTVAARDHNGILAPLMSVAFPSSTWESEISGAFKPFTHQPFFYTPTYRRMLLDE